ncbi:hypothetical protein [Ralstonia sp. 24A2]|uniref:hypothetical protein n=1 Tax=Ralstonia sp. 24A2 TaxID=3447364 RepID=UPI003F69D470
MPTSAQRCARRLPFWWTIDVTGMVASHAAMVVMVPALAEDGDIIRQRAFAPRIAYRGVPTDTLPVRTALGPYPTRAFDLSIASVMSVLSDGELSTSHAWLNNPSRGGQGAIPPEVGGGRQADAMLNAHQADLHSVCGQGTPAIAGAVVAGKRMQCYQPYLGTVLKAALLSHPSVAFTLICSVAARSQGARFKGICDEADAWGAGGCTAVHRLAWPGARSTCLASVALPQRACRRRTSIAFTRGHQIEPPAGAALPDVVAQTRSVTSNAFVLRPPAGTFL